MTPLTILIQTFTETGYMIHCLAHGHSEHKNTCQIFNRKILDTILKCYLKSIKILNNYTCLRPETFQVNNLIHD